MAKAESVASRLGDILKQIQSLGGKAGLIAVSKNQSVEKIREAYEAGQRDFGENRVEELTEKAPALDGLDIRWHFIGHLQSNKVKKLLSIPKLHSIHSVDSLKLLQGIHRQIALYPGENLLCFLQMNTSGENEKQGFADYVEIKAALQQARSMEPKLTILGLMTMGKIRSDDIIGDARLCFKKLRETRDQLTKELNVSGLKLSMGMSGDYVVALQEGSDFIRVGSALFA